LIKGEVHVIIFSNIQQLHFEVQSKEGVEWAPKKRMPNYIRKW